MGRLLWSLEKNEGMVEVGFFFVCGKSSGSKPMKDGGEGVWLQSGELSEATARAALS